MNFLYVHLIPRQYADFNQFAKASSNPLVYFFMADKRRWPMKSSEKSKYTQVIEFQWILRVKPSPFLTFLYKLTYKQEKTKRSFGDISSKFRKLQQTFTVPL